MAENLPGVGAFWRFICRVSVNQLAIYHALCCVLIPFVAIFHMSCNVDFTEIARRASEAETAD